MDEFDLFNNELTDEWDADAFYGAEGWDTESIYSEIDPIDPFYGEPGWTSTTAYDELFGDEMFDDDPLGIDGADPFEFGFELGLDFF